jgi:hypothetical protein
MSTSGVFIHYEDEVVNPLTPRKYTILNANSVFDLCSVLQEHIPGIIRDLPVNAFMDYIVKKCNKIKERQQESM